MGTLEIATKNEQAVKKLTRSLAPIRQEYADVRRKVRKRISSDDEVINKALEIRAQFRELRKRFEKKCQKVVDEVSNSIGVDKKQVVRIMGYRVNPKNGSYVLIDESEEQYEQE